VSSNSTTSPSKISTRAEKEVHSAAERLTGQINDALTAVAAQAPEGVQELDALADRHERAARDMAVAMRELAEERQQQGDE